MGTRSMTIFMDGNSELCRLYRQYDGYPDGHGLELAKACDRRITNGITALDSKSAYTTANGMGELAALAIMTLKAANERGNVYLEATGRDISDWAEYVYVVRGSEGNFPTIECSTKTGPWPNVQTSDGHVFTGLPSQWLMRYDPKV